MSTTQKQTIIQILNAAEWVCGTVFQQNYIPEYRTRINELRRDDFLIQARRCTQHQHKGMMQEWRLIPAVELNSASGATKRSETTDRSVSSSDHHKALEISRRIGNYAYFKPEKPKSCCDIWGKSQFYHARGCVNAIK